MAAARSIGNGEMNATRYSSLLANALKADICWRRNGRDNHMKRCEVEVKS